VGVRGGYFYRFEVISQAWSYLTKENQQLLLRIRHGAGLHYKFTLQSSNRKKKQLNTSYSVYYSKSNSRRQSDMKSDNLSQVVKLEP